MAQLFLFPEAEKINHFPTDGTIIIVPEAEKINHFHTNGDEFPLTKNPF